MSDAITLVEALIAEHGDVVSFRTPYGTSHFFNHPDHVQQVFHNPNLLRTPLIGVALGQGLLSSEGDHWRSERRLMQPMFHEQWLPAFGAVVLDLAADMLQRWQRSYCDTGVPFDVSDEMRRLALQIVVRGFFSTDLGEELDEWDTALTTAIDDLGALSVTPLGVPTRFSPARNASFRDAMTTLDRCVFRMIATRRALATRPHDLLSVLLDAHGEAGDRIIRDEIVTMLVAGHETTAIALAWTWHLLLQHPDIADRLTAEIDHGLQGRPPVVDDLPRLPYLRMVFEEAMRLYPPVCFMARQAAREEVIGGTNVPARAIVLVSAWTTHRHKDFWEDAGRFDPERFRPDRSRGRHRFAYFPFAGGRHQCIGQAFAMLEGQLILAAVLRRCRLRAVPGHVVEPLPSLTLRLKNGLRVTAEGRSPGTERRRDD